MNDGLGPFTEFMQVFEIAQSHHLLPEEREGVLELAQARFMGRSADPRLILIVSRLCERKPDAGRKKR